MELFEALGFSWKRSALPSELPIRKNMNRLHLDGVLPVYVRDACVLEGNFISLEDVKTIMVGVTVGGRSIADQNRVLDIAAAYSYMGANLPKSRALNVDLFAEYDQVVATKEAPFWGSNMKIQVEAPDMSTPERAGFAHAIRALQVADINPFERAFAAFLCGAGIPSFCKKLTAFLVMNSILMSSGLRPLTVSPNRSRDFYDHLIKFGSSTDATELMQFLVDCHPDRAWLTHTAGSGMDFERRNFAFAARVEKKPNHYWTELCTWPSDALDTGFVDERLLAAQATVDALSAMRRSPQ